MDKVLFLAAGRRVQMAEMFSKRGFEIFSYESDLTSPICQVVSVKEATKSWNDPEYLDEVLTIFEFDDIQLIIPFQDNAVAESHKIEHYVNRRGYGLPLAVSSPIMVANICYDKYLFEQWMLKEFPAIYPIAEEKDKLILKPRYGGGSKGIIKIENETALKKYSFHINSKEWVKQRKISGTEYSVDCYFDLVGKYVDSVPRRRILVGSSGEVYKSITERSKWLQALVKVVGEKLGIIGPANMQFILEKGTGEIYLFEINARFGGGYTLSIHAGMDAIKLIRRDYLGEKYDYEPDTWRDSLLLQRAYKDYYFQR